MQLLKHVVKQQYCI